MPRLLPILVLGATLVGCDAASGDVADRNADRRVVGTDSVDSIREEAPPVDDPRTYEEYVTERQRRVDTLEAAIGDATASGVESCRTLAVGEKACGGPDSFRVFSTEGTDVGLVEGRAQSITELDRYAILTFGLVSTCDVPIEPTPVLSEGRCVASGS